MPNFMKTHSISSGNIMWNRQISSIIIIMFSACTLCKMNTKFQIKPLVIILYYSTHFLHTHMEEMNKGLYATKKTETENYITICRHHFSGRKK